MIADVIKRPKENCLEFVRNLQKNHFFGQKSTSFVLISLVSKKESKNIGSLLSYGTSHSKNNVNKSDSCPCLTCKKIAQFEEIRKNFKSTLVARRSLSRKLIESLASDLNLL